MPGGQFVGDGPGIWQGQSQPVQLGHHKSVAELSGIASGGRETADCLLKVVQRWLRDGWSTRLLTCKVWLIVPLGA
jgi:hypothetical protein